MKKLLFFLALIFTIGIATSCDVLKQSVSTTSELYVGSINDQPVKFEDKSGYLHHFIDMKIAGFWAEYVKGVTFAPIKDFNFDSMADNSLTPSNQLIETSDGRKLIYVPLYDASGNLLIKPYTRELH